MHRSLKRFINRDPDRYITGFRVRLWPLLVTLPVVIKVWKSRGPGLRFRTDQPENASVMQPGNQLQVYLSGYRYQF